MTIVEVMFTIGATAGIIFYIANYLSVRGDDRAVHLANKFNDYYYYGLIIRSEKFRCITGFCVMSLFLSWGLYSLYMPDRGLTIWSYALIVVELLLLSSSVYDWYVRWELLKEH